MKTKQYYLDQLKDVEKNLARNDLNQLGIEHYTDIADHIKTLINEMDGVQ